MPQVRIAPVDDAIRFAGVKAVFENDHPGLRLTVCKIDGETSLRTEHGGMRVFWIYRGQGEVFLPKGFRTQEGDGGPLPPEYRPDALDPAFADTLARIKAGLASVSPGAVTPVRAILGRRKDGAFVGDFAGDLWKLEQTPRPWAKDEQVEAAIASLFRVYREQGFSTKQADSYEPLMEGDQVIACAGEEVKVRGRFDCLALENVGRKASHVSAVRRLRFLADSAGGCNPDFDPFRRLPLTWYANYPGESGDGLNWVNSHVVNIPKETSPTHFHPLRPVIGGQPQAEMYLVLDPGAYRLNTWGRAASLVVFPDLPDMTRYEQHPLEPGLFVYIPPGTGHRGLDVFVNVLTVPGFKPHNEYYLDRDICDLAGGKSPYNASLLDAKNYDRIEDLTTPKSVVLVLEDDPDRVAAMRQQMAARFPSYEVVLFDNAPDTIEWLRVNLDRAALICLDHDLGPNRVRAGETFDPGTGREVVDYLATRRPSCPVIVHTTNHLAAPGMERELTEAGWTFCRVVPYEDLRWIDEAWAEQLAAQLQSR